MPPGQPDHFVANSKVVADRILRAYGRSAEVIHPPIDTSRFHPTGDLPEDFYMVLSRLASYKRIDLAVRACNALGKNLVVIGHGPGSRSLGSFGSRPDRYLSGSRFRRRRRVRSSPVATPCSSLEKKTSAWRHWK